MTTPDPYGDRRAPLDYALLRDYLALAAMVAGAAGITLAGFLVAPELGLAVVSALLLAAGALLGTRRSPRR